MYQLLREDEDRRRRGERNVRDEGEVFEMARCSIIEGEKRSGIKPEVD